VNLSLTWRILWVSAIVPTIELVLAYLVVRWYLHRPHRPPPPDIILPEGWQRWEPDGRGCLRLYVWRAQRWHELRDRRIKVVEEPSET